MCIHVRRRPKLKCVKADAERKASERRQQPTLMGFFQQTKLGAEAYTSAGAVAGDESTAAAVLPPTINAPVLRESESLDEVACPCCTFLNRHSAQICSMCGGSMSGCDRKAATVSVAAAALELEQKPQEQQGGYSIRSFF